jgi:hypothetical protein
MGDLHCPARFLLVPPGSSAELGDERVAAVFTSTDAPALLTATALANDLDLKPHELSRPVAADDLADVADQFRGETVVVVAPLPIDGLRVVRTTAEPYLVVEYDEHGWRSR